MSKDDTQLPPVTEPGSQPDAGDGGVPKEGMSAGGKSDAGKSVDPKQFVPVAELNRLRSTMDKQVADQRRQFAELKTQYDQLMEWREKNETEGLTDEEMVAYMADKAQYEASQKVAEANQKSAQLEYERNVLSLKQYYLNKGAPREIIEMDDPTEMQEAFLNLLIERANKAEEQLSKSGKADQKDKQPPAVTTHKPAAGSPGKLSWSAVKPGSKEETELFNAVETGRIKPEDIEA